MSCPLRLVQSSVQHGVKYQVPGINVMVFCSGSGFRTGMHVTANRSANVGGSRRNGHLCKRRSRTSTAKPDKALNQGMDHFHPHPMLSYFLHVGYLQQCHPGITLHAVAAKAITQGFPRYMKAFPSRDRFEKERTSFFSGSRTVTVL